MQVLLGEKPVPLDSRGAWKPAKETEHVLAEVAAAQSPFWPVLDPLSSREGFSRAWIDYILGKQAEAALQLRRSPRARGVL